MSILPLVISRLTDGIFRIIVKSFQKIHTDVIINKDYHQLSEDIQPVFPENLRN